MSNIIKDDVYQIIEDEFKQVQISLGMYIGKKGTLAALHLLIETTNNAIDEVSNPLALGKIITITFDERNQVFGVADNSRGIPFDLMVNVSSKKHSSTKFNRNEKKMKTQAGRNGVGIIVTVAGCEFYTMTSYRNTESKKIEYIDCKLIDHGVTKLKKEKHGLEVTFKPSPKYLDGDIHVTLPMIEEYLRKLSYILQDEITINFIGYDLAYDETNPKSVVTKRTYTKQGLVENVKYMSSTLEFEPILVSLETEDYDLDVAFSYDKTLDDNVVESYCNYIITTEGGHHVTVSMRAICEFFARKAKELDPNNKYEIIYDDCRKGLVMAINCRHINPAFEGQHKSKVSNEDVLTTGKRELVQALTQYFSNNNNELRKVIAYLRQIAKVRLTANKIKGVVQKSTTNFMDDFEIPMFLNVANPNSSGYKELLIVEGDSAKGAVDTARTNTFQAILGTRGVVDNVQEWTISEMLSKDSFFKGLITLMGCGIGKNFDINKLKYDKLIILTDVDVDGAYITSLLIVFYANFYPEIILAGKLYKALPPLMKIDKRPIAKWYNGTEYLYSKEDYYDLIDKIISENTEICLYENETGDEVINLSKRERKEWLKMNSEYLSLLQNLAKRTAAKPLILEYVCYYALVYPNRDDFEIAITNKFPEIELVGESLVGSYEGEQICIIIDKIFFNIVKKFIELLAQNTSLFVACKNKNDKEDYYERITLGQFFTMMDKLYPVNITQRFKGLGEANADILFSTTLNPKTRRLVRLNMSDVDKAKETLEMLHGKSKKMIAKRREMLEKASISYFDIDN